MKVGTRVKNLMEQARPSAKDMVRKTHYVNGKIYRRFEKLCREQGRSTSELINAMIMDFVETFGGEEK